MEEVFWEVPPSRRIVRGAIGLANCRIENCRLVMIGIAGGPEVRHQLGLRPSTSTARAQGHQTMSGAPAINFMTVTDSNLPDARIEHNIMEVHYGTPLSREESSAIASLVRELRGVLVESGLGQADMEEIGSQLQAVEAQVSASNPSRQGIKQALTRVVQTVRSTSEFATSSAALVDVVNKLHDALPGI
jgi:hypothetical protein